MKRGTIEWRETPDGLRAFPRVRVHGKRVRCGGGFITEAEAQEAIDAVLVAAAEHAGAGATPTLRAHVLGWLDARELAGKVRDVDNERSLVATHILPDAIADLALDELGPRDVRRFVARLAAKPVTRARRKGTDGVERYQVDGRTLSRQTVKHVVRVLRGALERAVRDELLVTNPADVDVEEEMPSAARTDETWTYLTAAEIAALLASPALDEDERLLLTVAIYTGPRVSELWGLRWGDVHEAAARPEVVYRFSRDDATKAGKVRRAGLFDAAIAAFARLRELAGGEPDAAVLVWPPPRRDGTRSKDDDHGWADKPERIRGEYHVRPGMKTRAGITRDVRFHDLRHTCASALVSGYWGPPWRLEEVRAFLGHEDIRTTQRYAHLAPDGLERLVRQTAARPTAGPPPNPSKRASARKQRARDRGFEPLTYGSGGRGARESSREVAPQVGQPWAGDLRELAEDVVRRVAARDAFAVDVAVQLAERVLDAADAEMATAARAARGETG